MKLYFRLILSSVLILTVAGIVLSQPRPVAAAGVVGNGTPASCTEAALTTALTGGGTVTFNCGPNPVTITVSARKTINATTQVNGNGLVTLNGGSNGVFLVPAAKTLTLQNLTIGNAATTQGGVENQGQLTLQNVTFKDNVRGLNNHSGGVTTIQAGTFQNNKPAGAIFNQGGTVTVNGTLFETNHASLGGAIDSEGNSQLSVTGSVFNSNTSGSGGGGAVYNGVNSTVNIATSSFGNNSTTGGGGAINNTGLMTVTRTAIFSNSALAGGGIQTREHLRVENSRINSNTVTIYGGGAIYHHHLNSSSSSLTLINTTLDGNGGAGASGGGVFFNSENGLLNLTNVTISGNTIQNGGGGVYLALGIATLTHTTLFNNVATGNSGDNIQNGDGAKWGTITLKNSLVSSGTCNGPITNGGGNMQDSAGAGCGASLTGNPQLGPLQDNGGWTPTHGLPTNSPARNTAGNTNCVPFDQRGVTRPQNGQCDIGAFEYGAAPGLTGITPNLKVVNSPAFTLTVNGTNFIGGPNGSQVLWDGAPLTTVFVNGSRLDALVPANHLTTVGVVNITVQTLAFDGGTSGAQPFNIVAAAPPAQFVFLPVILK